jgi:hypothetical protein
MEAVTAPGGTRPGPSLHDSASSEQVPPGPRTDRFIAHRPDGPGHPCFPCNICTLLHLGPGFIPRCTADFLPVLHLVIFFQPCCFRPSATPLPHPVSWRSDESDPVRSRSLRLSSYWLSRAGPAGRLTPRRTTALRESSRRGRAQGAPARSTPGVATSSVTNAWRKGGCGARDLCPTLHQPGPWRAGRWHCAVTVPGRWGGCAAAVRPRLPGGDVTFSPARPRDRARLAFRYPPSGLGESAGGSRSGGGVLLAIWELGT